MDVVVPPAMRPRTSETRLTGATMISLRKPNSRSQRTDMPCMDEEKSRVMPMMPGTRKPM